MNTVDFSNLVNIKSFLYNEFYICGGSDLPAVLFVLLDILDWLLKECGERTDFNSHFGYGCYDRGSAYLLLALCHHSDLVVYTGSIELCRMTETGRQLLYILQKYVESDFKEIIRSSGKGYDNLYYNVNTI